MQEKENFLSKSIHTNSDPTQSHLIVCAPCSDDGDYDWVTETGVSEAIAPFKKWFVDNEIPHVFEMNWGNPWLDNVPGSNATFCVNVIVRANERPMTKEERMIFELKFCAIPEYLDMCSIH